MDKLFDWFDALSKDPIRMAFWGLIFGGVSVAIGAIAAIAAILAARYAKASPTQADLFRVEQNTAHLAEMKQTISIIDTRSQQLMDKDKLTEYANRVSVSVRGKGIQVESLSINLTIKDASVSLTRIDLINGAYNVFGHSTCVEVEEFNYVAPVSSKVMFNWFQGGEAIRHFDQKRLQFRVWMMVKDEEVYRYVPIVLTSGLVGTSQGNQPDWTIEGDI